MICKSCTEGDHCGPPGVPGPCQTCQHLPRETGQLPREAAPEPSPVSPDPGASRHTADGRTADPDLYTSPTAALLTDWMRAVRAGQDAKAGVLHGVLAARLGRLT
jgi:hypothetical protein